MGFRLDFDADPGNEIRRMLREQLGRARKQLTAGEDPVAGVHEARKAFKRARALIPRLRPAIGKDLAREANGALRDLGRQLSGQRDADVLVETIAYVAANGDGEVGPSHVRAVRSMIERSRQAVGAPAMSDVLSGVDATLARIETLPFGAIDRRAVIKGFVRAYAKGHALVPVAYADGHDETFHDLRKAVQTHWRHCGVLRDLWPEAMAVRIDAARDLSQIIGLDHDLSVLALFVSDPAGGGALRPVGRERIVSACRRLQEDQRTAARPIARKLYAASPHGTTEWLEALWVTDRAPRKRDAVLDEDQLATV